MCDKIDDEQTFFYNSSIFGFPALAKRGRIYSPENSKTARDNDF